MGDVKLKEITKAKFMEYLENDANFEFLGEIEGKVYARQRNYPSNIPSSQRPSFRLVFAVP